ncbi:hypothetical protein NSS79_01205 [Paenibacillus sp. FSL L8-0436]|uniref:hypothetical protein n=1 Tax=Paenibacillus sp. FSL L8-0436 TaxID=2954686 RepID=UPI003158847B
MKDQRKAEALAAERMQLLAPLLAEGLDPAGDRSYRLRSSSMISPLFSGCSSAYWLQKHTE